MKTWRALSLAAMLVLSAAGCARVDPLEDMRIEAEAKARLVAEKDANLTRLGVHSVNGTVYLTGAVESADQRARADALVREVRGVRRVVDRLDVTPGASPTPSSPPASR